MPTGYTAKLFEGEQSFNDFVMGCARAFGACVMMRDQPSSTEIPEKFEPSDYNSKALAEAEEKILKLSRMTPEERDIFSQDIINMEIKCHKDQLEKCKISNKKLNDMAAKVRQWTPPSFDHNELKKFMLNQLMISIEDETYHEKEILKSEGKTLQSVYDDAFKDANEDIKYHTNGQAEEIKRTDSRNLWVKQLRDSLK